MKNVETLGVFSVQLTADTKKEITILDIPATRPANLRHDLRQQNYRPCRNGFDSLRALVTDPVFQRITGVDEKTRIQRNVDLPSANLFFVYIHTQDEEEPYLFLDGENYSRGRHYRPVGMLVETYHEE